MVPNLLNQDEYDDWSRRDVTNILVKTEIKTEEFTETSDLDESGSVTCIHNKQHLLNVSNVKIEEEQQSSDAGHRYNVSQRKRTRRKKLLLPMHSPETIKDTSFRKRRRQKQQFSLETFFENEEQELCFRFGASYKEFVLPLGVEPTPSAKQSYLAGAQKVKIQE